VVDKHTLPLFPRVSVIIPTSNRPSSLKRLLTSLGEATAVHEIIVVDDGSQPPVSVTASNVLLLRIPQRGLVSAARNLGASRACGEILIFVDDDCVLNGSSILLLRDAFVGNPAIGIVGPVISYFSDSSTIWCAGVVRTKWLGRTKFRGRGRNLTHARRLPLRCDDFPSVFAVRQSCFQEIGGFDEVNFPMGLEEADFAARARERGYAVQLVPRALAWHDLRPHDPLVRRLHAVEPRRAFHTARGRVLFLRKHSPTSPVRALRLVFWFVVLVPGYLAGIALGSGLTFKGKLELAHSFVAGLQQGMAGSLRP
jgi:GT2 family glycosyltransferase